jgi:hypothetical protein
MAYEVIAKPQPETFAVRPNLEDYENVRTSFDYERVTDELCGLPGGDHRRRYHSRPRPHRRGPRVPSAAGGCRRPRGGPGRRPRRAGA